MLLYRVDAAVARAEAAFKEAEDYLEEAKAVRFSKGLSVASCSIPVLVLLVDV